MIWTVKMDDLLRKLYPDKTNREISDLTGWSYYHVSNRAKVLDLHKNPEARSRASGKTQWTPEMDSSLLENFHRMNNQQLADALGLTLTVTRARLYELGKKRMELEYWTEEQVQYLLKNFRQIGDLELAEIFESKWPKAKRWSKKHIEKKRKYLKLKRTRKEIAEIHQRNVDNGRFRMCVIKRWEKTGMAQEGEVRYWREHSGRMVPRIKIGGKFIHYGRHRYEQIHGPIPEGVNIVFADNDPRNLDDSNLLAITDAELSRRNSQTSSVGLSDNYVASMLTLGKPEARKIVKSMPELIELKRNQLLLQRELNKNEK